LALRRGDIIAASPGKLRLISLDEVHSLSRVFSSRRDVDWPILCSVRRSDVHRRSQKNTVRADTMKRSGSPSRVSSLLAGIEPLSMIEEA
jgi:hypothetical protein